MIDHARGHDDAPQDFSRAFAIGVTLNAAYILVQVVFGLFGHSLALLADAGHNLSDVLGLMLAWGASHLAKRPATPTRTYGWRSTSIMAALFNAIFLMVAVGAITWEAIHRFARGEVVDANIVIWVAALGVVLNGATAWLFMSGRKSDLNLRGAFTHMAADTAISAGVVVAGLAIRFTGWTWLDPAASILINIVIVIGTWGLLRESFNLATAAVPAHIDALQVKKYLSDLAAVAGVHDLHIWAMSTTQIALTAHLVMPAAGDRDAFLHEVCHDLQRHFGIDHATIQIEQDAQSCSLA
jgi:cobalt-zinc-cadmium efflux system protein